MMTDDSDIYRKVEVLSRIIAHLTGPDGRDGKVAQMAKMLEDHEGRIRKAEIAAAKGAVLVGTIAAIGGAVLSFLLKFLGG